MYDLSFPEMDLGQFSGHAACQDDGVDRGYSPKAIDVHVHVALGNLAHRDRNGPSQTAALPFFPFALWARCRTLRQKEAGAEEHAAKGRPHCPVFRDASHNMTMEEEFVVGYC